MLVTLSGIVMPVKLVQPAKAPLPILVSLLSLPKVMLVRLVQELKAERSMLVTLSGIVMLVRLAQSAKAKPSILVSLLFLPKVMLVRLSQS